jgi:hypothetical protein
VSRLCTACHVKATRREKDSIWNSSATLFGDEQFRASLTSPTTIIQSPDIVPDKVKEVKSNALGLDRDLKHSDQDSRKEGKLKPSATLVDVFGLGIS